MGLQLGYKVVTIIKIHPPLLISAITIGGQVSYSVYEWTYPFPYDGPLCVFDTLEHAKQFKASYGGMDIYPCEYIPAIGADSIWLRTYPMSGHTGYRDSVYISLSIDQLPLGTMLAAAVRLLPKEGL